MKIYTALQMGEYHQNYCEDYLVVSDYGNDRLLCAVMDGCTMGTDSYFASALVGKILRHIARNQYYKDFYTAALSRSSLHDDLRSVMSALFERLAELRNLLSLNTNELLSTLVLLLVNNKTSEGVVLVVGDGVVSVNGQITEFDQDNKPDYLGYHLGKDFNDWFGQQKQVIHCTDIQDISIATDGILSFNKVVAEPKETIDAATLLMNDRGNEQQEDMLCLTLKKLEHQYGVKPTDDLAVIRIIRDSVPQNT